MEEYFELEFVEDEPWMWELEEDLEDLDDLEKDMNMQYNAGPSVKQIEYDLWRAKKGDEKND